VLQLSVVWSVETTGAARTAPALPPVQRQCPSGGEQASGLASWGNATWNRGWRTAQEAFLETECG